MADADAPTVEHVAEYLADAARQEHSPRSVVAVLGHYLTLGITKCQALHAIRLARRIAPAWDHMLLSYESQIREAL